MTLRFTRAARRKFLAVVAHIAADDPLAARRFRSKAEKVLRRLEQFPRSGRHLPEFPELPHREVIVRPYRFFYRLRGNVVWIVAIWHGAQQADPPSRARHPGRTS